jgi:hypothetical protein
VVRVVVGQAVVVVLAVYLLALQSLIPTQYTQSQSVLVVLEQIPMGQLVQTVEILYLVLMLLLP